MQAVIMAGGKGTRLAAITKDMPETLLVVDGITSAGVHDTRFDEWGIDILITGSQKAFMLPPGLAFITLSQKAWNMVEKSTLPKFYFNLKTELKNKLKEYEKRIAEVEGTKNGHKAARTWYGRRIHIE